MASESKQTVYLLEVVDVFAKLEANTGQAPIGATSQYQLDIVDAGAALGSKEWTLTLTGPSDGTLYQIQTYGIPDDDVATFVNLKAGTSLTASQIVDVRRNLNDASFLEVETT